MHKNGSTIKYTHPWVKDYFKEIRFYNRSIEKPKIKRLKNIYLSAELPFFERLSIIKTNQTFSEYAMFYKVKIVGRKDLIVQLEVSKLSIKNFFGYLLNDTKGFKHQITVKILLKRYKPNGEIEFAPVYFSSWTKTVINSRFKLEINKKIAEKLDYSGIKFLVKEKDFHKTEIKNNIYINVFSYENGLIFQFIFLIKNLKIQWIYCFQLMMVNRFLKSKSTVKK